jgi:hypothetical protein
VAAIGFSAGTLSSLAASSPLNIAIRVGYNNTTKLGQWMPVAVDISNSGPEVDGTLNVMASNNGNGGPPIGTVIYQVPVSLAGGATKHFRTYISLDFGGQIRASVMQDGREVASQTSNIANTFSGLMVGVLSDQPSTLDGFASARPGGSAPQIVHLASTDLADSALVLRAFDLLAIDDFATDTLTGGQKAALTDYVMQGGGLLLGTGGSWHKTLAGLPAAIVPMQVSGSTVLGSSPALAGANGVEVATGSLSAGAVAWLSEGSRPLVIEAQVGKGLVTMATFDWGQDSIANSSVALLRQVLVRATFGNTTNPTAIGPFAAKMGIGNSIAAKGGQMSQSLGNLPPLDLPAWWLIGVLVLVYVVLVGPANYFALRAIGHRALAWVTVPAIALLASGGAYGASLITKGTSVLANEVSVIHVQPGWDRAYQEEYTGIMAPTRGDYEVGIGAGHTLISPIYYYSGNAQDPNLGAMRVNAATDAVTLPGMTAFTLRGFANERILAASPQVNGEVRLVGGQITGAIKNLSPIQFTDGVVFSGNSYQKLGKLAPDGTLSFSLLPTSSAYQGPPIFVNLYPNNYNFNGMPPNNSSDAEREAETRSAVLSTLVGNSFGGMAATNLPTVVLWTKQPFQNVTVNGGHPRTYSESAVVMTLPFGQIGAGALPGGVVQGRMVDIDASINQGGPPGLVIGQKGSVSYSFTPKLAPGMHLTAASITSLNPYGAKGFVGAATAPATVKAQVWDWSGAAWVDLNYLDTGAMSIPDASVNPVTGEVRFKVGSDGQFATGWLSLSGTVS